MDGDGDIDGDPSPMADEQAHQESVPAEAAESSSPYGHTQEVHQILSHLLHLSASRRFPVQYPDLRRDFDGYVVVMELNVQNGGGFGFSGVPASEEAIASRRLHFHNRFSAPMYISAVRHYNAFSHVMEEIVLDDIPTMLFVVGGVLVADSGGYANGGFGAIPASGDAMADLPKTTVGEGEIKGEKAECAVCLEAYQVGDTVRTMPCSHDFHESCIFEWLRVSRLCPLCRFALPAAAETESFMGED